MLKKIIFLSAAVSTLSFAQMGIDPRECKMSQKVTLAGAKGNDCITPEDCASRKGHIVERGDTSVCALAGDPGYDAKKVVAPTAPKKK